MSLLYPINQLLEQLQQVLEVLTDRQYTTPVDLLSGAPPGSHVRHVIEFYGELLAGYETGIVNYDQRKRDHSIESDRRVAIGKLQEIGRAIARPDKELSLAGEYNQGQTVTVPTNYLRELIYNLEHTVHHMALLRVGIGVVSAVPLPAGFGVASSTIKFRTACAQ
jgi:hypothetical protein